MKKLLLLLFISTFSFSQEYDFQELCIACAESNGFYCGDDPSNWTQYSPLGCVPNGANGLFYLNDNWLDCVDGSDEDGAVPTLIDECVPQNECDTVFVDIPVVEYIYETDTLEVPFYIYETIIQLDTIIETEYITQIIIDTVEIETFVPEYIYVIDTVTVYEDILDTLYVDVIEEVEVVVFDTIVEVQYVEILITDTVIEYVEIINTEYIDCNTGLPCNTGINELIEKSKNTGLLYDLNGRTLIRPEGIYIENGLIKYKL